MKDKPKLGRGLGDVSSYFLSRTHEREEEPAEESPAAAPVRSATICCPGSGSLQACFVSNLALEAAKRRHTVTVWDRSGPENTGVKDLMLSVLSPDESLPGTSYVRLYGLPDITIVKGDPGVPEQEAAASGDNTGSGYFLVNAPGTLDSLPAKDRPDNCIFITETDEKSLLKAYAFIKAEHARNHDSRFHIIFSSDHEEGEEKSVFRRFSGFLDAYAGCNVHYLGRLVQDEQLAVSLSEAKPLVLSRAGSISRDCIMEICSRFFNGTSAQTEKDCGPCAS